MCGIGGIYRLGRRPIRKWHMQTLATELQHRGTDATGWAIMNEDGTISAFKVAYPAWKAAALPEFHKWCDAVLTDKARILLVHTRAYTKGTPHNNENNHPLYVNADPKKGERIAGVIVHNGMVRNDDGLFEVNKSLKAFKRSCQTDSDAFRAVLDNWGGVDKGLIKEMRIVDGTAAVAAMHSSSPGRLLLLRDSNPLVLGATQDTLAFASTKEALHKILKPWIKLHNIPMQVHAPDLSFVVMPDETGYIIGPDGLESHDVFKCNGRRTGGYTKYNKNTNYWNRQETARLAKLSEKRHLNVLEDSPGLTPVAQAVAQGRVKTLIDEPKSATEGPGPSKSHNGNVMNDPSLFEYVICPNVECNKHVALSADDRQLASLAMLACSTCGTNLADAPNASLSVN